jgi:hypothetical protein
VWRHLCTVGVWAIRKRAHATSSHLPPRPHQSTPCTLHAPNAKLPSNAVPSNHILSEWETSSIHTTSDPSVHGLTVTKLQARIHRATAQDCEQLLRPLIAAQSDTAAAGACTSAALEATLVRLRNLLSPEIPTAPLNLFNASRLLCALTPLELPSPDEMSVLLSRSITAALTPPPPMSSQVTAAAAAAAAALAQRLCRCSDAASDGDTAEGSLYLDDETEPPGRLERVRGVLKHLSGQVDLQAALTTAINTVVEAPEGMVSLRSVSNVLAAAEVVQEGLSHEMAQWATAPHVVAAVRSARGGDAAHCISKIACTFAKAGETPAPGWIAAVAAFVATRAPELSMRSLSLVAFGASRLDGIGGWWADDVAKRAMCASLQRELVLRCDHPLLSPRIAAFLVRARRCWPPLRPVPPVLVCTPGLWLRAA